MLVLIFLDLSVSPVIVGPSCLSVHWEPVPLLARYRVLIIDKSKSKFLIETAPSENPTGRSEKTYSEARFFIKSAFFF